MAYPTTKIRVNATCRKCPHKVHRMEMKTAISCTILRHTKILIAVRSEERFSRNAETDLVCRLLLEKKKNIQKHDGQRAQKPSAQFLYFSHHHILLLFFLSFFVFATLRPPPISTLFPCTTLFRSYPTTKIRVNATCRKCPHKVHRMEMKTAISCTILRHTKILIAV